MFEKYFVSEIVSVHDNANTDLFWIMTKILDLTLQQCLSYVFINENQVFDILLMELLNLVLLQIRFVLQRQIMLFYAFVSHTNSMRT